VAVDGGAGHAEDVGDLLDGVLATVVELLGEGGLLGCELAAAAAAAAAAAVRRLMITAGWRPRSRISGAATAEVFPDPVDPMMMRESSGRRATSRLRGVRPRSASAAVRIRGRGRASTRVPRTTRPVAVEVTSSEAGRHGESAQPSGSA